MSVRPLRHDKRCGWFSKSRGLSASVSFLSSPPPPRLLAPFFAWPLLQNSTETLASQAIEAGKFGERPRVDSNRTDVVSLLVGMLDLVLFILKWLPRSCEIGAGYS